ncbi:MAG: VIT domain-containing protein [Thermoanaerobaculia bacterium]
MQSQTRTLTLTAAVILASIAAFFLFAAPQNKTNTPAPARERVVAPPESKSPAPPSVAPITFADPDGQELILEEMTARTAIHGMLSLTELELRFRNPQSRRIEGRFTCTLPANAAISRFAKEVNGQLMEGEVVERLRANQVYEQFLHQMRDPALLEQDQGNRFSARIFPIEANAPVRLLLSYTALLPMQNASRTYTLPLRGLPKINKFTFRGFVTPVPGEGVQGTMSTSSAQVSSFEETDWTPDRDITMSWSADRDTPRARVLRSGDFYLASYRFAEVSPAQGHTRSGNWIFYVDTSASSAEGAPHRIRALEEVLAALPAREPVQVIAFDQELTTLASGSASEVSRTIGEKLRTRLFLGGTDISAMLRDAAKRLKDDPSRTVVIASDLVATLGAVESHEVKDAINALPANSTVHTLILGSREDAPTAKAVTNGHGRVVRIGFTESLTSRAREAAEELRRPIGATFDIRDNAAEWIYPTHFEDVQPGDEVIALAKVKPGQEPSPNFGVSVTPARLSASTFAPLLEREAYRAYLEYLGEREASESNESVRRALATEQVRVSTEQRVVIPRTTMLVLESEWDYQRFGLDRRALAAILTIDAGGIGRIDRMNHERQVIVQNVPPPQQPRPIPITKSEPARRINPQFRDERITVTAEAPIVDVEATGAAASVAPQDLVPAFEVATEEGVAGGVEGGVAGGVVGGVVDGAASVAEAINVPEPQPGRARINERDDAALRVGGERRRGVEAKKDSISWIKQSRPPRSRIKELEAELNANPKDRALYNQLGELLAAYDEWSSLRRLALDWQPYDPENPQVYELLGMADENLGNANEAARAYASLIEIAPAKTELLQRAGLLLLGIHRAEIAETPLRRALAARPDRVNGYRHLALMLWSEGRHEEAAGVLESATQREYPNWYLDVKRVVREELGYVYRGWIAKEPSRRGEIVARAREHDVDIDRRDALRVTLAWETDANDVDLHVVDPAGEEAFYSHKSTRSGLELYQDVTQGLGPEVIRTSKTTKGKYHIGVRYFAAGPMGISRGVVIVMRGEDVEVHPFRLTEGGEDIRYVTAIDLKG